MKNRQFTDASSPSQRAARTRRKCPLVKSNVWPVASRTAVAEKFPIGTFRTNLSRTASFVLAIVPFDQVFINVSDWFEAGQFTGPGRTLQGTGQHQGKRQSLEPFTKPSCGALATIGERKIGQPGMLA